MSPASHDLGSAVVLATYRMAVDDTLTSPFARHFTSLATHTIEIRPVGNGRVHLDAFLVLR